MGLFAMGTSCLALVWVIGRSRVPEPPERMRPFTAAILSRGTARASVDGLAAELRVPPARPPVDGVDAYLRRPRRGGEGDIEPVIGAEDRIGGPEIGAVHRGGQGGRKGAVQVHVHIDGKDQIRVHA